MSTADLSSVAVTAGNAIGRAFSVVTLLPALFFVTVTWTLFATKAFSGRPDPEGLIRAAQALSLGGIGLLLLAAIALAYSLHPVQYALTQLLEGYWGATPTGLALMHWRIAAHRRRQRSLSNSLEKAEDAIQRSEDLDPASSAADGHYLMHILRQAATTKALRQLPTDPARIMPTRLGNVLRRHEDLAGQPYGLPGVSVVPSLTLVARGEVNRYLADSTEQLDAAVSVCVVTAGATVLVAAATLTDGWWLLTALVPYALCWIAYRGAVSAAAGYGLAMRHLIDLERFNLYREMHLAEPRTLGEEHAVAAQLALLLDPPEGWELNRSGHPVIPGGDTVEITFMRESDATQGPNKSPR